jgi:hypothetical protein
VKNRDYSRYEMERESASSKRRKRVFVSRAENGVRAGPSVRRSAAAPDRLTLGLRIPNAVNRDVLRSPRRAREHLDDATQPVGLSKTPQGLGGRLAGLEAGQPFRRR